MRKGGSRSMGRGPSVVGRIFKWLIVLLVAAVVVGAVGPWRATLQKKGKSLFDSLRGKVAPHYNLVTPMGATATSSLLGHDPGLAIDEAPNTYWAAGLTTNDGVGQVLTITFDKKENLDQINFFSGVADAFVSEPRPSEVLFTYSTGQTDDLTLKNQPGAQALTLKNGHGVTNVKVTIEGTYPSSSGNHHVAIGEIEFYTKQ